MILATVGMQLPFDRLIRLIDVIAPELSCPVIAQIGEGRYKPANMEWQHSLRHSEFERLARAATLIVAHAGIGTVLTARRLRKPLILFPRREALGEHRNDHQVATARAMTGRPGVGVALHGADLRSFLRHPETIGIPEPVDTSAGQKLRSALTEYLAKSVRSKPAGRSERRPGSRLTT